MSPTVWRRHNKLATIVGRTELTILATIDVRPTSMVPQFETPSAHVCVQHDAHGAARRAGPSACVSRRPARVLNLADVYQNIIQDFQQSQATQMRDALRQLRS